MSGRLRNRATDHGGRVVGGLMLTSLLLGMAVPTAAQGSPSPAPTDDARSPNDGRPVWTPGPGHGGTRTIRDIWDFQPLAPIPPGTYSIDPDLDPSTPLRVVYEVPVEGWSMWIGAVRFQDDGGHVGVSITTVKNLVTDGCSDHSWAEPPVGPSVVDLAEALATLAPFEVTTPPEDVTIYGYSGKHLVLTVPEPPGDGAGDPAFTGCVGRQLKSWVAPFDTEPGDAYYGYTGPGYTEEFWILDVQGTRLMIAAETSSGAAETYLAEREAILDTIRIEP